jgi:hypothetical protein
MMGKTASALFIFIFFGSLFTGLHYGLYYLLSRQGRFNVNEIQVEGNCLLTGREVVEASMLPDRIGIFDINLARIRENIRRNYLVEDAVVMLYPPDRVLIRVSERIPAAIIVDKEKKAFLCDGNGLILQRKPVSGYPFIFLDYTLEDNKAVSDEIVLILLKNLTGFDRRNEIEKISVGKKNGILITVKGLDSTVFSSGKSIPDSDLFNKMLSIAARIKMKGLSVRYIDINKDSAIGYE